MADHMDNLFSNAFKPQNDRRAQMQRERHEAIQAFENVESALKNDPAFGQTPHPWVRELMTKDPEVAAEFAFEAIMLFTFCEAFFSTPDGANGTEWRARVVNALGSWVRRWPLDFPHYVKAMLLTEYMQAAVSERSSKTAETENEFRRKIINHFGNLFPEFNFVCIEKPTRNGRIDIYAEAKADRRPVLMELKIDGMNPAGQFLEYALDFKNPRLIAITRKPIDKAVRVKGVEYFTYGNGRLSSEAPS